MNIYPNIQIYIPPNDLKSVEFWMGFREKYKSKTSSMVRQIVEERFENADKDNEKYFEISVDGKLYGGFLKLIEN